MRKRSPIRACMLYCCICMLPGLLYAQNKPSPALFQYDPHLPFEWQETNRKDSAGIRLSELAFKVDTLHTATALLTAPAGEGPFPLIVFQHGKHDNKQAFLQEALHFSAKGYVCLSLDAPWHWPAAGASPRQPEYQDQIICNVKAIERAIDLFSTLPAIEPRMIFFIGHGYGAALGKLLTGLDPRIKGAVLMAGQVDSVCARMEPDTSNSSPRLKVFHQFGSRDEYVPVERARAYVNAMPDPKQYRFYDATHPLNDSARQDRCKWIMEETAALKLAYNR